MKVKALVQTAFCEKNRMDVNENHQKHFRVLSIFYQMTYPEDIHKVISDHKLYELTSIEWQELNGIIGYLSSKQLIKSAYATFNERCFTITAQGIDEIERKMYAKENQKKRFEVLKIFYERTYPEDIHKVISDHKLYELTSIEWQELNGIIGYLRSKQLIKSAYATFNERCFTITAQGIDEIETKYHHTLTSLVPQQNISPILHTSTSLIHILHLSDLHFGTLEQANLWSNQLAEDLQNDRNISHLDALILSGDIANYSTETEYSAAKEFINELAREFQIRRSHIIIVPGNHDLNWELGDKAISSDENGQLKRDQALHQRRFDNFRNFYQAIKGESYPLEYEHQGILYHLPKQKLLILGLNSAWKLHRYQTKDANINDQALTNALKKIRDNEDLYEGCVKIAVWHHPLNSSGEDRIKDQCFMERLAQNGFRLALHGHVHTAKKDLFNYDYTSNTTGRKLDIICAGTFGAPTKELVTGYPWQYNLLKIEDNQLTVYTRRREEPNGTWKPDARWLQGAGKTPLDYYAISLLVP